MPATSSRTAASSSSKYGTLYRALLKLEPQPGYRIPEWGASHNNRRARFGKLTRAGRQQAETESRLGEKATAILARVVSPEESL